VYCGVVIKPDLCFSIEFTEIAVFFNGVGDADENPLKIICYIKD